ncbi:hypothetical protein ACEPAH_4240 [Sanghuangporus vaninii]
MYARYLRGVAASSLLRRSAPSSTTRRCLATVESTPTTSDSQPQPAVLGDAATKGAHSLEAFISASVNNANPLSVSQSVSQDDTPEDFAEEVSKHDEIEPNEDTERQSKKSGRISSSPSIVVTTGRKSKHMPGTLAVVRELEQRFGRIREFRILRDKDSPTDYLTTCFITFYDDASVEKVQDALQGGSAGKIMLDAPLDWDRSRQLEGGVGLEEIQPFLLPLIATNMTVQDIDTDERIEEAVDSVEKALESTETKLDGGEHDDSSQVATSPSVDAYECSIQIKPDYQVSMPHLHDRRIRSLRTPEQRTRLMHAFIRWAGFYPHYHFSDLEAEPEAKNSDGLSGGTKKAETVRLATRDMSSALLRFRRRLQDLGHLEHGLTYRDGRLMMPEWEASVRPEQTEAVTTSTPSESDVETSRDKVERPKPTKSKWDKPTTEEEESLERLFARSSLLRAQPNVKSIQSSTKVVKAVLKTASIESSPQQVDAPSNSKPVVRQPEDLDLAPTETFASTSASTTPREYLTETVNNRSRRAKKKAEQEKEGFKAKLLGWLSR